MKDILEKKIEGTMTLEPFKEIPLSISIDNLRELVRDAWLFYDEFVFESIAWYFYKKNSQLFNFEIPDLRQLEEEGMFYDEESDEKFELYEIPEKFELSERLEEDYIKVSIDDKERQIPVLLLDFLAYDYNLKKVLHRLENNNGDFNIRAFWVRKNSLFENYGAYLGKAYCELSRIIERENYSLSSSKLQALKEAIENTTFNEKKLEIAFDKVFGCRSCEEYEKNHYFMENDYDKNLVVAFYGYLSTYTGDDVVGYAMEFLQKFEKKTVANDLVIYYLKEAMNQLENKLYFPDLFKKNINALFYELEVEPHFRPENFRRHNGRKDILPDTINEELDEDIISYVEGNLPETIDNDLETAIAIYILLGDIFRYNSTFAIDEDFEKISDISEVNLEKKEIICTQWAAIYSKLLQRYGIESTIGGTKNTHMFVNLRIGSMMLKGDATLFGYIYDNNNYYLSDLTRIKTGLPISNFSLVEKAYKDQCYIAKNKEKLDEAISAVYKKLNRKVAEPGKMEKIVQKYQENATRRMMKDKNNGDIRTKKEIDYRISTLNYFYNMDVEKAKVERAQFFSKYLSAVLEGFPKESFNNISLCQKEEDGKQSLVKMIAISDSKNKVYYYLETEQGFKEFGLEEIGKEFQKRKLSFRYNDQKVLGWKEQDLKNFKKGTR